VLDDVSFGLRESAMTAIVGETGSGKSLMALSMMGGLAASNFVKTGGSIEYAGTTSRPTTSGPAGASVEASSPWPSRTPALR